jgi:hypothetical protein
MPDLGFVLAQTMYSIGLISMHFLPSVILEPHFDPGGEKKSTRLSFSEDFH